MIRFLIWDADGTIFDTYPSFGKAFAAALAELGITAPTDWLVDLCKQSVSHCATTLAGSFNLDANDVLRGYIKHYAAIPPQEQPPFPGVDELCARVRATGGANFIVTHRDKQSLAQLLAVHQMTGHFVDCITADNGYPRKPNPASMKEMIARHQLPRGQVLAIGDRDIDVLAGRTAGVHTCLFGAASSKVAADHSITGFEELYHLIA